MQTLNYKCAFCEKLFAKEKTLTVHICEQKRRHLAKTEKHVQLAFLAFQKFYELNKISTTKKTFEEFIKSSYYTSFVKFGSFLANARPIYPERFIDHVITKGVKLDQWCRDSVYEEYVKQLVKIEPADGAIQRTIETMIVWAEKNEAKWEHYFCYVTVHRFVHDVKEGLISPWLLLNIKSGQDLIRKLSPEQLELISPIIDPQFWIKKFATSKEDIKLIREIIKQAGIL